MKPLQIEGIRALVANGSVNFCGIVSIATKPCTGARRKKPDTRVSTIRYRVDVNQIFFIANRAGRPRLFSKADTCLAWLRSVGISHIDGILL